MSTVFNLWQTYSTVVKLTPVETLTKNGIPFTNTTSAAIVSFPTLSCKMPSTSMYSAWTGLGCCGQFLLLGWDHYSHKWCQRCECLQWRQGNSVWYIPYYQKFSVTGSQTLKMPNWTPWSLTVLCGIIILVFLPPCLQVTNHSLPYHDSRVHCGSCRTGHIFQA